MEKRVCDTCGIPRTKSSFACHYDSHLEICHACKDFCIHRVKLATKRGITVHQLFATEGDKTRLQRYNSLTKAGVVWEHVARRQHCTRKRSTKRRRNSASSASSNDSAAAPSATKRQRRRRVKTTAAPAAAATTGVRASGRARRKPAALAEYVDDAGSITSHSSGESVGSAATDAALDVVPVAGNDVPRPSQQPAEWGPVFQDFDEAVDALVGSQDLAASGISLDELTRVVSALDAQNPPLFDSLDQQLVGAGGGCDGLTSAPVPHLSLDVPSMLDALAPSDWEHVFMSPLPNVASSSSHLTVVM